MLATFADWVVPLLKPRVVASRRKELEAAIRRNKKNIVHAEREIAQQQVFKQNAIEENYLLEARLLNHCLAHGLPAPTEQPATKDYILFRMLGPAATREAKT